MAGKPMPPTTESSLSDTLTPIQIRVLQCLVAGQSVTAAAKEAGLHRTTVHLWTRTHPDFARALLALRQNRADRLVDELGDLADLAINTFRQILSDEKAPAAARLKAAMEVVELVESQRPHHALHRSLGSRVRETGHRSAHRRSHRRAPAREAHSQYGKYGRP